ncbi:MAG: hypothetical protein RMY16_13055 [Nostoc sp. DedQUE12b]|uniref:hypothetical protein n=1 Tax=Nostoc sp. DedQUE12b TaxID=3075398 RepID=UPI002AD25D41|nr:hypothetical protein [Nostoc sp. DedQUE12b]MDZ8086466.1 hypothetical protein [Nostoc sp. DedQUE12b]
MDIEELLERYAAGERNFREVDLSSSDLTGVNLSGGYTITYELARQIKYCDRLR